MAAYLRTRSALSIGAVEPLLLATILIISGNAVPLSQAEPDARIRWLGKEARGVAVYGDWDAWKSPGVPLLRDETGVLVADVFLPADCLQSKLVVSGICCYHYKFVIQLQLRQHWTHDPNQPWDTDEQGAKYNILCKYSSSMRGPQVVNGKAQANIVRLSSKADAASAKSTRKATIGDTTKAMGVPTTRPSLPTPQPTSCVLLPATKFYNNSQSLVIMSTRLAWDCCELCGNRSGCVAFNWRPTPLARNCELLGDEPGKPQGNVLTSAGLLRRYASHYVSTGSNLLEASSLNPTILSRRRAKRLRGQV